MKDQIDPWDSYARLQAALMRSSRIDSHSWGMEAALNGILQSGHNSASSTPESISRNCDTAGRRERARSAIRKRHHAELGANPTVDPVVMLDARRVLKRIEASVNVFQWAFLQAIGEGFTCAEIGLAEGQPTGSVRVKLCRLREQLGNLLSAA